MENNLHDQTQEFKQNDQQKEQIFKEQKFTFFKKYNWLFYAFIASLNMGIAQFIQGTYLSAEGFVACGYYGFVSLTLVVMYKLLFQIKNMQINGMFIDYNNSNIFKQDRSINFDNIKLILISAYCNIAHVILFTFSFKYAKIAGINQGVIPALTSCATVYNLIIFYLFFGEKVTKTKIFGCFITILSVLFLSIDSSSNTNKTETGENQSSFGLLAIFLALIVPIHFSFKHYIIRKSKKNYNQYDFPVDSSIIETSFYTAVAIYYQVSIGFKLEMFLIGSLSGILQAIGKILISFAISAGQAGPSQAIMSTNSVYQTILTVFIDSQPLVTLQLAGLSSGILGTLIIFFGDYIIINLTKIFSNNMQIHP